MKSSLLFLALLMPWGMTKGQSQTDESRCIEQSAEIFQRLNIVVTENHFPPLSFDPAHLKVFYPPDLIRRVKTLEFRTPEGIYTKFLLGSCELIEFTRDDVTYGGEGSGYSQPPKPKWTAEQAIVIAKTYAIAVFGSFPKNVTAPVAEMEVNGGGHTFFAGRWHVRWPRVDPDGHLFNIDALHVYIFEDQGLTAASLNFFSDYRQPKGPLISREEALRIAAPAAQILADRIGGNLKLGSYEIEEVIVNPNHVFQVKEVALFSSEARLAWNVIYQITSNGVSTDHQVHVAIDAQTKEAIDGDYH